PLQARRARRDGLHDDRVSCADARRADPRHALRSHAGVSVVMSVRAPTAALVAVALAAAILYAARLDRVPTFLSTDETAFALQAHSIATTAHDERGRFLPLYFQIFENVWFHPALVYSMAPVLAVFRPMPWAVRLPTVIVALSNILLVCALARRLGVS